MNDIPEPDWNSLPDAEASFPPLKVVHGHAAGNEKENRLFPRHVGRLPDTTTTDLVAAIEAERDGKVKAIRIPWWKLNKSIGFGLRPGNVTIVTGPPGTSKSYLVLNILLAAGRSGFRWRLLPLEDDAQTWILKALAVNTDDWRLVSQPENDEERVTLGNYKLDVLTEYQDFADGLHQNIAENPRMPISGYGGRVVLDVKYEDVLRFVEDEAEDSHLICVDPISQITFDPDGRDFRGQADFMRRLVAVAASTRAHILLVAHNAKQQYRGVGDSVDGVQGSAMLGRLAHNILTINRHDPAIEDEVYSSFSPTVTHRLTISVTKCRGGMTGEKFAFDLSQYGPTFKEYGMIKFGALKRRAGQ